MPAYRSVEELPDGRLTFRICAPEADAVSITSIDTVPPFFDGAPTGLPMTKDSLGLWSATTGRPVTADTYRYNFLIDGLRVPDPLATNFVQDRTGVNSVMDVRGGADFARWDKDIPHGAVAEVRYWSSSLGIPRRAFQGWRYLAAHEAPADTAVDERAAPGLPPALVAQLRTLGLL